MKRVLKIIIICLLVSVSTRGADIGFRPTTDPVDYPSLSTIIRLFTGNYDPEGFKTSNFHRFAFIKNPDGWFVRPEFYDRYQEGILLEIWSSKLGYPGSIDTTRVGDIYSVSEFVSHNDHYNYSIHPFYGYTSWKDDVISFYDNYDPSILPDRYLYGLARAYSRKASEIFWSHSPFSDPDMARGENAKNREINNYLELSHSAINLYKLLYSRNPGYLTMVGRMDVKYANEILAAFYELELFGHSKKARKFLDEYHSDTLYHEFWKQYAFQVLNQSAPDALLFTNGDNDTYPLLWAQEKYGIRNDVMIVNLSLLNDPKYFDLLCQNLMPDKRPETGMSSARLDKLAESVVLIDAETDIPGYRYAHEFEQILYHQLDEKVTIVTMDTTGYLKVFLTKEGLIDTLVFKMGAAGTVLTVPEIIVRDIINHNIGKRPIHFTSGMQTRYKEIFGTSQLIETGTLYRLRDSQDQNFMIEGQLYDTASLSNFANNSDFSPARQGYYSRTIVSNLFFEAHFLLIYLENAYSFVNSLRTRLLDFIENFPVSEYGVNHYQLNAINELYKIDGGSKRAFQFFYDFFDQLNKEIEIIEVSDENPMDIKLLNYYRSIVENGKYMSSIVNDQKLTELIQNTEKLITERLLIAPDISIQ